MPFSISIFFDSPLFDIQSLQNKNATNRSTTHKKWPLRPKFHRSIAQETKVKYLGV